MRDIKKEKEEKMIALDLAKERGEYSFDQYLGDLRDNEDYRIQQRNESSNPRINDEKDILDKYGSKLYRMGRRSRLGVIGGQDQENATGVKEGTITNGTLENKLEFYERRSALKDRTIHGT